MDITLTFAQQLELQAALVTLGEKKCPLVTSFTLASVRRQVAALLTDLEAVRQRLRVEHCDKNDAGEPIKNAQGEFTFSDMPAFTAAWQQALGMTATVSIAKLLSAKDFALTGVTPNELYAITPLIDPPTISTLE